MRTTRRRRRVRKRNTNNDIPKIALNSTGSRIDRLLRIGAGSTSNGRRPRPAAVNAPTTARDDVDDVDDEGTFVGSSSSSSTSSLIAPVLSTWTSHYNNDHLPKAARFEVVVVDHPTEQDSLKTHCTPSRRIVLHSQTQPKQQRQKQKQPKQRKSAFSKTTSIVASLSSSSSSSILFVPRSLLFFFAALQLVFLLSIATTHPGGGASTAVVEGLTLTMGLLKVGTPKSWDDSKRDLGYIRKAGVRQFISTYNRVKDLKGDELLWGDEIEYGVFVMDHDAKKVRLSLRAKQIMDELNQKEAEHLQMVEGCNWVPEYGAWMVEATPSRPYTGYTFDLLRVERNMRLRRKRILTVLGEDEVAPTISSFFMLGAQGDDGSVPPSKPGGPRTLSDYISDDIINPHPRFGTLTANIRQRRGSKVNIQVPLFRDVNTPEYEGYPTIADHGCCGGDVLTLWRYGKNDACFEKYGHEFVSVGCSVSPADELLDDETDEANIERGQALQKWLVDVKCPGCKGLFYRRAPNEIVPDADWPRNGEIVVGYELQDPKGWIRLQNGYYLPMASENGKVQFLQKITNRTAAGMNASVSNAELKRIGSSTPLFRTSSGEFAPGALQMAATAEAVPDTTVNTDLATLLAEEAASGKTVAAVLSPPAPQEVPLTCCGGGGDGTVPSTGTSSTAGETDATAASTTVPQAPRKDERVRPAIHMDAMAFGMGCCCLQITFQAKDMDESRYIYDQLAVMAPIMMALTAATPILKGRLADTDARWGIISESVDDRTLAERGRDDPDSPHAHLNHEGHRRIYKSRYDSISTYIYQGAGTCGDEESAGMLANRVLNMYNDIPVPVDGGTYRQLREAGVDPALAQHVAHLFIRDPLVVFDGAVEEVDDETQTEHWESIQSTNWNSVRWKPPPPRNSPNDPHIGWRTEFRSMELQLTDFENAAFTAFVVLLTRVILTFDLNLYIPMSRVDANMQRAHSRNASAKGKFFFRRHMAPLEKDDEGYDMEYVSMFSRAANGDQADNQEDIGLNVEPSQDSNSNLSGSSSNSDDNISYHRKRAPCAPGSLEENSYEEMTMAEIMTGKGDYFPGLIPLVLAYLDHINCDKVTRGRLTAYLDFIEQRARGELITPATWMRNFVRNHPSYKGDSVVSDEISYDLMKACKDIGEGRLHVPELLGNIKIEPITPEGAYEVKLDSGRVQNDRLVRLLRRYTSRASFNSSGMSTLSAPLSGGGGGGGGIVNGAADTIRGSLRMMDWNPDI